jgi:hypothetical protein
MVWVWLKLDRNEREWSKKAPPPGLANQISRRTKIRVGVGFHTGAVAAGESGDHLQTA